MWRRKYLCLHFDTHWCLSRSTVTVAHCVTLAEMLFMYHFPLGVLSSAAMLMVRVGSSELSPPAIKNIWWQTDEITLVCQHYLNLCYTTDASCMGVTDVRRLAGNNMQYGAVDTLSKACKFSVSVVSQVSCCVSFSRYV